MKGQWPLPSRLWVNIICRPSSDCLLLSRPLGKIAKDVCGDSCIQIVQVGAIECSAQDGGGRPRVTLCLLIPKFGFSIVPSE